MAIEITELLGTDSISGSRTTINANFNLLADELNEIIDELNISTSSGNIDVSGATGGQIKAKTLVADTLQLPSSGTAKATITGSTGKMVAKIIELDTSLTVPTVSITTSLTSELGTFNGIVVFNDLVKLKGGIAIQSPAKVDVGSITTHTVKNTDSIIIFDFVTTSPNTLTLDADTVDPLVDGHICTFINKGVDTGTLVTTNIKGYSSKTVTFKASYLSAITVMYNESSDDFTIVSSNNIDIV